MIFKIGQIATGAHVVKISLEDEQNSWIMSNYVPINPALREFEFCSGQIDEDMMKSLYIKLHEFFKNKGFNVCKSDEIVAKHDNKKK